MSHRVIAAIFGLLATGAAIPSHGALILTYSGTFGSVDSNVAGLRGANFVFAATFPTSQYVDNGSGQPALFAIATKFTVAGATLSGTDGEYTLVHPLMMLPQLGGAFTTPPSQPMHFVRPGLRLSPNLGDLFGGNGASVSIGDLPRLSHFPTAISAPTIRALPHNVVYQIDNASISTIPEPSTLAIWSLLGLFVAVGARWRRCRNMRSLTDRSGVYGR